MLDLGQYHGGFYCGPSFHIRSESWPDLWAFATHVAKTRWFMFYLDSTDRRFDPITLIFNGEVIWVLRHDYRVEPTWRVYGDIVDVEYTNEHMTFVQVEFFDEPTEDPAPVHWWLPTALGYALDAAEPIIKQLIDGEAVTHTSILMEPATANYTYPEGF